MKTKIRFGFFCTCGASSFHVLRTTLAKGCILRRRECVTCGERITTKERPIGSVIANTPATSIGQIAKSISFLADLASGNSAEPKN